MPASANQGFATIAPMRFAAYVAAAAVLHGLLWYLESLGALRHFGRLRGQPLVPILAVLVAMVAVRLLQRHAMTVAMLPAVAVAAWFLPLGWIALLGGAAFSGWLVARTPLPTSARVALVLLATAAVPTLRAGWLGFEVGAALPMTLATSIVWSALLVRSLLYQTEYARLFPHERSLLCYLGSLSTSLLAGGHLMPRVTYRRLFGEYGRVDGEKTLRAGLGLLALAIFYSWLMPNLLEPLTSTPLSAIGAAAQQGSLTRILTQHGRGSVGLALILWFPMRYFQIATGMFFVIAVLRLLGFNLGSGFRFPFISRSFIDYWRRANYYMREAQLVLFYFPVAKRLRRWLKPPMVTVLAVSAAMLGHLGLIAAAGFLQPSRPGEPFRHTTLTVIARFSVVATLTVVSAWRQQRRRNPAAKDGLLLHIRQTLVVLVVLDLNHAIWQLRLHGLSWDQVTAVYRFALTGSP